MQCVELKPEWAKGYSRLGAAHYGLQQWDKAIAAYEAGLKLDPANAGLQDALDQAREAQEAPPSGGGPGAEPQGRAGGCSLLWLG